MSAPTGSVPSRDIPPAPAPSSGGIRRAALIGALVVAVMLTGVIVWHSQNAQPPRLAAPSLGAAAPPVGRLAPDFSAPLMGGGTFVLRSVRGRPLVLNFWASWCVPCREEIPLLVRLHKVYGPRGVQFVGIDAEDQAPAARAFVAQHGVGYPVAVLEDERVIDAYAIPGLPTTVFIGADGVVAGKVVGGFVGPEGEKLLIARLDRLLAGTHR